MSDATRQDGAPWRNLYGRRKGKRLRPGRQTLLEMRLEALSAPNVAPAANPARSPLDLATLLPGVEEVWLEIGFGGGEHLVAEARANPRVGFIGAETFVEGVAKLLSAVEREGLERVRLHAGDARDLLDVLPEGGIGRAYLLYPDPWPKRRHRGRRFVDAANLDALARALRPGAELRIATDIDAYAAHTLAAMRGRREFEWLAERPSDWREPWPGWPGTRYEAKALRQGRRPTYLRFRRR